MVYRMRETSYLFVLSADPSYFHLIKHFQTRNQNYHEDSVSSMNYDITFNRKFRFSIHRFEMYFAEGKIAAKMNSYKVS